MRALAVLPALGLAACNPPAADDYLARVGVAERGAPAAPLDTPDTTGAMWAQSPANARRLLYGKPGKPPLFALECEGSGAGSKLAYTRFSPADPYAKAVLALIGNGHVSRLKIDAYHVPGVGGGKWLWRGSLPAQSLDFEGLTGGRQVEATVPGAGSLILNPSPLPGELILLCRSQVPPAAPVSEPAATGAAGPNPAGTTDRAEPLQPLEKQGTS